VTGERQISDKRRFWRRLIARTDDRFDDHLRRMKGDD